MLIISAPSYIKDLIEKVIKSIKYGYGSIYEVGEQTDITNIISYLKMFFVPSLILFMGLYSNDKKKLKIIYINILILIIANFIIGARTNSIKLILILVLFYIYHIKKITLKIFIVIMIIGILMLSASSFIAKTRSIENKNIDSIINNFKENNEESSVISTLNEFGFNIYSTYWTMKLVPNVKDFDKGYSYFASIMALIPSFFYGGYSFSSRAALPNWLQKTLNMDYGPGYSFIAETYYNFGKYGLIAMFIIGIIIAKLYSNSNKYDDLKKLRDILILIILYQTIFMARDSALLIYRNIFYLAVIPNIAINLFKRYYDNKKVNENKIV